MTRDKESLAEENRQLRALLAQHGIPWTGTGGVDEFRQNGLPAAYASSGSHSGSYNQGSAGFNSPPHLAHQMSSDDYSTPSPPHINGNSRSVAAQQTQRGVDYDQAGIDFVLTYGNSSNIPSNIKRSPQ